jgi:branched-chain amino acid transport system permease protein
MSPKLRALGMSAGVAAFVLLPLVGTNYTLLLVNLICINVILAVGLDLVTGRTGQISLGHAGFFAVGAYGSALATVSFGVPFWLSAPAAGLLCAAVSLVVGGPALRIRGHYLALATLAFGEIVQLTLIHWESLTNGTRGLTVPAATLAGIRFTTDLSLYFLIVPLTLVLILLASNIVASGVGRAMASLRMSEHAAAAVGISIPRVKLLAFALSAFYAGMAGALYAVVVKFLDPAAFSVLASILYLTMIAVGGMRSIGGPILGAALLTALPEILGPLKHFMELANGLLLLAFIIFMPEGIYGRLRALPGALRRRSTPEPA